MHMWLQASHKFDRPEKKNLGLFFFLACGDSVSPWRDHQAAEPGGSREGEEVAAELPKQPEGGETGQ